MRDIIKKETSPVNEESEIIEAILEHVIVVRMPPKKEYTIRAKIISIEKGTPRIVTPEGF